jgi:hypothetical protein
MRRGKTAAYQQEYRLKNPERIKEYERRKYQKHKEAIKARNKDWAQRNREKVNAYQRRKWRRRQYGISEEYYQDMLEKQNGRCAICGQRPKRILSVDHCHNTERIRGLLCHFCNAGLGMFKDSKALLNSAVSYLEVA